MTTGTSTARTIPLAAAHCDLTQQGDRLAFRFPDRAGTLTPARWEFRDRQDLVEYLAGLLSVEVVNGGLRGSVVCRGKYDRQAGNGARAFTFGDPILDLITDASGDLVLGKQRHHLATLELDSARYRSGGIRQIDLSGMSDAMRDQQIVRAATGQGDMTLVECSAEVVALASTNPSQRDFYRNGHHLRFKAWKKSRLVYWSMGAEIETWGHDFSTAEIQSRYLDTVVGQTCAAVKVDSDSDTNDDYLDEYEWGVNAPQPLRVMSNCTANWHGLTFGGQVTAGPACFVVG